MRENRLSPNRLLIQDLNDSEERGYFDPIGTTEMYEISGNLIGYYRHHVRLVLDIVANAFSPRVPLIWAEELVKRHGGLPKSYVYDLVSVYSSFFFLQHENYNLSRVYEKWENITYHPRLLGSGFRDRDKWKVTMEDMGNYTEGRRPLDLQKLEEEDHTGGRKKCKIDFTEEDDFDQWAIELDTVTLSLFTAMDIMQNGNDLCQHPKMTTPRFSPTLAAQPQVHYIVVEPSELWNPAPVEKMGCMNGMMMEGTEYKFKDTKIAFIPYCVYPENEFDRRGTSSYYRPPLYSNIHVFSDLSTVAGPCDEKSLDDLFKMLTGGSGFNDVYNYYCTLSERRRRRRDELEGCTLTEKLELETSFAVGLKLKLCLQYLNTEFGSLNKKESMIKLLKHLRNYFRLPDSMCFPFDDWSLIYHQCHVLFSAGSRVRFSWMAGMREMTSLAYLLTSHVPELYEKRQNYYRPTATNPSTLVWLRDMDCLPIHLCGPNRAVAWVPRNDRFNKKTVQSAQKISGRLQPGRDDGGKNPGPALDPFHQWNNPHDTDSDDEDAPERTFPQCNKYIPPPKFLPK